MTQPSVGSARGGGDLGARTLVVEGGHVLGGRIDVEGNKNAALPLLAACLLTDEVCELDNMPRIRDVEVMIDLLKSVGAEAKGAGTTTVTVQCGRVTGTEPDPRLVGRLRGSVLLVGPMLARAGSVRLAPPGGDFPARRTLTSHLHALRQMGATDTAADRRADSYEIAAPRGLKHASIYMEEASVTGTETALLAAAAADGVTELRHAACEPHVVELCRFLEAMGASVTGAGTPTIRIQGTSNRVGVRHRLRGDYIEAGSWAVTTAVTGGDVTIGGVEPEDLEPVLAILSRMRVDCGFEQGRLVVRPSTPVSMRQITTAPWPGFPSDMVSLVSVLATQATGRTLIHDWMYELRLFALEQLSGMGADLFLCDPHRMIVNGPRALSGRHLDTRDLRSGMALIAAALAARGTSRIGPLETVERGYAHVVERLQALGAQVAIEGA